MYEEQVNFFKCFSHSSRVKLAKLISENSEKTVRDLADDLEMTHSATSRHLNILKVQGLVTVRRDGQNRYYSLNPEVIKKRFNEFLDLIKK